MKTLRSSQVINDKIWEELSEKYGCINENPNLSKCPFQAFRKGRHDGPTYYSQNGEEGILEHIFQKIGFTNKWCLELGAFDGKTLSNTLYFKEKYGFKRVLLEGDKAKITKNTTSDKIKLAIVNSKNIESLTPELPDIYDLLSLDIDGDDYWVWKAMKKKARLVILEYNCGIRNDIPLVIEEGKGKVYASLGRRGGKQAYYGANLLAFYRLAKEKGYEFVTTLQDNAFFVLKEDFSKLGMKILTEDQIMENYFNASEYWGKQHRDLSDSIWLVME